MVSGIILASQSPRRKELLEQVGIEFTIIPSTVDEVVTKSNPVEIVTELSRQKAVDVGDDPRNSIERGSIIIGADTIVVFDGIIMGKPKDSADAVRMLSMLQGQTHHVYTGVTLYYKDHQRSELCSFAEETKVSFYPMSPKEITDYVASGEPMDKAGAYGIQGLSAVYIKQIEGDYNNVVGLPVAAIYQMLKEKGWK